MTPRKIDKVYKNVYFSEQKTTKPQTLLNDENTKENKTQNKASSSAKKLKGLGLLNNSPYYKEIMNHKKDVTKENNIKT